MQFNPIQTNSDQICFAFEIESDPVSLCWHHLWNEFTRAVSGDWQCPCCHSAALPALAATVWHSQAGHHGVVVALLTGSLLGPAQSHFRELHQAGGCTAGQLKPKNMGLLLFGFFSSIKAVLKARQHLFLNIYVFIYGKRKFKRQPAFWHCRYIVMCPPLSAYFKGQRSFCKSLQKAPRDCAMVCKEKTIRNRSC